MNFDEALKNYRAGTANQAQKELVEAELRKYEALNDLLYDDLPPAAGEEAEPPPTEGAAAPESGTGAPEGDKGGAEAGGAPTKTPGSKKAPQDDARDFARMIRRAVRRAFIKAGLAVAALVVAVVLFIQFAAPGLVSSFYYDPSVVLATSPGRENWPGEHVEQLGLDLSVYAELRRPTTSIHTVRAEARGYGAYDVTIQGGDSWTGVDYTTHGGRLVRNELTMYDPMLLAGYQEAGRSDVVQYALDGEPTVWQTIAGPGEWRGLNEDPLFVTGREKIAALAEDDPEGWRAYPTFISFESDLDYAGLLAFLEELGQQGFWWLAARVEPGTDLGPMGFRMPFFKGNFITEQYSPPEYPWLRFTVGSGGDPAQAGNTKALNSSLQSEDFMAGHFGQMLRYMSEQETFAAMMGEDPQALRSAADYVAKNGLKIYAAYARLNVTALQMLAERGDLGFFCETGPEVQGTIFMLD